MKPLLLAFAALVPGAVAQSFTVPSTWRKPTSSRSLTELTGIAQAADDSIKPYLNATTGLLSNFYYFNTIATAYSSLARKDRLAGTQSNKWIVNAIKTANSTYNGFSIGYTTTTWIGWGIAATDAYKTYGDPSLLQIAYGTWNSIAQYQITESQARAGSHPLKNYTFVSECNDKTIAGGVFGNTNLTGSIWLYSQTASYFAQFSALLADVEASQGRDNTKYKNAGVLSANFLLNQLIDPSSLVMNTLIINGTTACAVGSKTWSENAAHTIEAFAVLAGVTGDSKWSDAVSQTIASATTTSAWVGNDGVVVNDNGAEDEWDKIAKGHLLASLYEPWARTKNSDMKSYIAAFVNVQQNALLDLATSGNSGFYSSDWHGPAASSFTPEGMTAAMCLATTFVGVNNQSATTSSSQSSSATSSSPSPGPTEPSKSDSKSLAVPLGAGLGAGIPVLLLALLGLFFLCRRRRNTGSEPDHEKFDPQTQQHYPTLDSTPYAAPTDPQPTSAYAPSTDVRPASSYAPPTDVQSYSSYAPPTDIQPYSPYASPPVAPVPMPSPPPTSVPSPPPGRIEFATAPSGKETMFTWQGNQQPDPATGSGVASGYGANQIPAEHIPTDDLVRILNDRVSRGYEPQGDGPPVYLENNR